MTGAPTPVSPQQLSDVHIALDAAAQQAIAESAGAASDEDDS